MTTHTLDLAAFRQLFPEFTALSDTVITMYWTMAVVELGAEDGVILSGDKLQLALNLLTAHITKLYQMQQSSAMTGGASLSGPITAASEGSVSATVAAPPIKSAWSHWLSMTPYGMQLRGLLNIAAAGGLLIGGLPERSAFRKVGGVY